MEGGGEGDGILNELNSFRSGFCPGFCPGVGFLVGSY